MCLPSQARVFEVYDIEKTELEGAFSLLNNLKGTEVVIDCTSFINNMTVSQKDKNLVFQISHSECLEDLKRVFKVPKIRQCVDYDDFEYTINECDQS